ncbi:MAG: aminotransferase class III-fold pyridoxal phosphate-dependent enzyme [Ardenticatenaceae bacterium]|nr:aminotransferase class III-fold pyridoxal phosphate-dependent enzyme [Ardenticatenaceae bacterium]MCB8972423.1 aminotransferase class III-fold pyridoxal phosphate-dependent enzyme [Ardenticatenaceae bacterium]
MPDVTILRPYFSLEDAVQLAHTQYSLTTTARTLPSERDQNFHLTAANGRQYILKIAGLTESLATLELENALMAHLTRHSPLANLTPGLVLNTDHAPITHAAAPDGTQFPVRLITHLPGTLLAHTKPHSPALLHSLGHTLGQLDAALTTFDHPAAHRELKWDLNRADFIANYLHFIPDAAQRELVQGFLNQFVQHTQPRLGRLRHSVIHNDANDYNLLTVNQQISGIFDFGDALHTVTISELAIAAAYAILHKPDPLAAAAHVVRGYHATHPLSEEEVSLLFSLIAMRLCVSVTMSAYQATQEPDNDYLQISALPAWQTLEILAQTSPLLAEATFRHACGWEPVAKSASVINWLRENDGQFANVLNTNWQNTQPIVFDLTPGSLLLGQLPNPGDTQAFTDLLFEQLTSKTSVPSVVKKIGIGRYDEPRRIYTADSFRIPGNDRDEWRTIHIGLDLFAVAGTAVHAPLPATIHSFANNAARFDYGPVIVLQHDVSEDLTFYTLYGHLSEASLDDLTIGQPIAQGQKFAEIGNFPSNGDWPPHLHLQILVDLLHYPVTLSPGHLSPLHPATDFPGVAAPSQRPIWRSLCPDPNLLLGIPEEIFPTLTRSKAEILALRQKHLGPSLSISYQNPLHIVRGQGQYLYDEHNQPYLDAVNNVPHVGHNHPKVVKAAQLQTAVLNTNTRYLHDNLVEYAARLTATLPEPLSVCYFVCSGSEANELALRLARTHTGQRDLLVLDGAYHGNTAALIDISSYKFDGPGGAGKPEHVHVLPMPDPYRGLYRGSGVEYGRRYAQHAQEIIDELQAQGQGIAGFIGEPLLGCGGQIVLPDGYFQALFPIIRAAGGVCIADEVQVGFGRVGSHMWAFETQGVVPDIVTLGKPIGNGHPLAAVVTTPEIAASFANGMEYFNTFGGNPVSCAIGLAVLDVIEKEKLQENALVVGNRLLAGLRGLQTQFPLIGDVRGLGLYIGAELVRDQQTLEPAAEEASYIANRMRDKGILISTDGPLHNVLKIKPPLVFTEENADFLVKTLGDVLEEVIE